MISRSCSWCHEMNPETERFCRSCQHEAHVCRMGCACPRCLRAQRSASGVPVAVAEPVEQRVTEWKIELPAGVHFWEELPNAVEVERTRVRPELATQIRALMELLVAEFGFDLCFSIWISNGLVAASNASQGYIVPLVATESPPVVS